MHDVKFVFLDIIKESYSDIIQKAEIIEERLRLTLYDESFIDILYPIPLKYSFHWQQKNKIFRFDTAPHHRDLITFPRHIHYETEINVIPDEILHGTSPEENFKLFLDWVRLQQAR